MEIQLDETLEDLHQIFILSAVFKQYFESLRRKNYYLRLIEGVAASKHWFIRDFLFRGEVKGVCTFFSMLVLFLITLILLQHLKAKEKNH